MNKNRIISVLLGVVFVFSLLSTSYFGYKYYTELTDLMTSENQTQELAEKFSLELSDKEPTIKSTEIKVDLDEVKKEVVDAKAWIYAPLINLSEVITQANDNDYYLHYSPTKQRSILGTIFLDAQNKSTLEDNFVNYIFGHKSSKSSVRFSSLDAYFKRDKEEFFYLYQDNKQYKYRVMDTFTVNPTNSLYPEGLFKKTEVDLFKKALLENGANSKEVEKINKENKYTLLVTCLESWDSSERRIVLGELVETLKY